MEMKLLFLLSMAYLADAATPKPLAIIDVCPAEKAPHKNVTVTSQYQPITYCVPTTTEVHGTAETKYPLKSTALYVSTVIPCKYNGKKEQQCTVTKTDQTVLCRQTKTVSTTTVHVPATTHKVNGTMVTNKPSTITQRTTVSKQYNAQYTHVGFMAIPGYDGCRRCTECKPTKGVATQGFNVTECHWASKSPQTTCTTYSENWVSTSVKAPTTVATATCASTAAVRAPGTYTFTFTETVPATVYTAPGAPKGPPATTITCPEQPWYYTVTKTCGGPTTFTITDTVTSTVTYTPPPSTSRCSEASTTSPTPSTTSTTPPATPANPTSASTVNPTHGPSGYGSTSSSSTTTTTTSTTSSSSTSCTTGSSTTAAPTSGGPTMYPSSTTTSSSSSGGKGGMYSNPIEPTVYRRKRGDTIVIRRPT